jgi:hypothetical protein
MSVHEKWLNFVQALEYLRSHGVPITRRSLYSNVSRYRQPKSYKIRGQLRFTITDLDAWIDANTRER